MDSIQPNARAVVEYTLRDEKGDILDASDEAQGGQPIVYVHGYAMVVPGLEAALAGMRAGQHKEVVIGPEDAFGEHDPELVLEVDRSEFPKPDKVAVGDELVAESAEGDQVVMRVIEVNDEGVVVDANHPLAGKTLHYTVQVREVREATEAEVADAAAAFEEAGYGGEADEAPGDDQGLVQLRGKKPS